MALRNLLISRNIASLRFPESRRGTSKDDHIASLRVLHVLLAETITLPLDLQHASQDLF